MQIFQWIEEVGNPFLVANNQIGADMSSAQALLRRHDAFESDTEVPVRMKIPLFFSLSPFLSLSLGLLLCRPRYLAVGYGHSFPSFPSPTFSLDKFFLFVSFLSLSLSPSPLFLSLSLSLCSLCLSVCLSLFQGRLWSE